MLALWLILAGSCLAQIDLATVWLDPAKTAQKSLVQFPASMLTNQYTAERDKLNGYVQIAKTACNSLCSDQSGVGYGSSVQFSAIPMRASNVVETSCWCCVKNEKGQCYTNFAPDQQWGPWVDMMPDLLDQLATQGCTTVSQSVVNNLKPVLLELLSGNPPKPNKTIKFHWGGPKSQVGGTYYVYFIDSKGNVVVKPLVNNGCTFPNMSGKVAVTVSAMSDPKAPSLYIVARNTVTA